MDPERPRRRRIDRGHIVNLARRRHPVADPDRRYGPGRALDGRFVERSSRHSDGDRAVRRIGRLQDDRPLSVLEGQASDRRFDDPGTLRLHSRRMGRIVRRNAEVVEDDCAVARQRRRGYEVDCPGDDRAELLAARHLGDEAPGAAFVLPGPFPAAARGHVDLELDERRRRGRLLLRGAGRARAPCGRTHGDGER